MLEGRREGAVFFWEEILFTEIAYLWNKNMDFNPSINMDSEHFKTFIAYCITSYMYWSEDLAWKIKDSNRHSIKVKTNNQEHTHAPKNKHTMCLPLSCSLPSAMSLIIDKVFFLCARLSPSLSPGQGLNIECEASWSSLLYQSVSLAPSHILL